MPGFSMYYSLKRRVRREHGVDLHAVVGQVGSDGPLEIGDGTVHEGIKSEIE